MLRNILKVIAIVLFLQGCAVLDGNGPIYSASEDKAVIILSAEYKNTCKYPLMKSLTSIMVHDHPRKVSVNPFYIQQRSLAVNNQFSKNDFGENGYVFTKILEPGKYSVHVVSAQCKGASSWTDSPITALYDLKAGDKLYLGFADIHIDEKEKKVDVSDKYKRDFEILAKKWPKIVGVKYKKALLNDFHKDHY